MALQRKLTIRLPIIFRKNALRLNYRPVASTIDVEFPDDIDPAKAPELTDAVIREVHQTL